MPTQQVGYISEDCSFNDHDVCTGASPNGDACDCWCHDEDPYDDDDDEDEDE